MKSNCSFFGSEQKFQALGLLAEFLLNLQTLSDKIMIEVCCAIILKGSNLLAVQRGPKSNHPWKWEFPGGKINLDETAPQCIVREIVEELSVGIEIIHQFSSVEFNYGPGYICLVPFACRILRGEIMLTEHVAQRWFELKNWESIDWLEADRELIRQNYAGLELLVSENRGETILPGSEILW